MNTASTSIAKTYRCKNPARQTILAAGGALAVIALTRPMFSQYPAALPILLIFAALAPALLTDKNLPRIFPANKSKVLSDVKLLAITCAITLPPAFAFLWLMSITQIARPLNPPHLTTTTITAWLAYQLLCAAVPEELFFRGFIQRNLTKLSPCKGGVPRRGEGVLPEPSNDNLSEPKRPLFERAQRTPVISSERQRVEKSFTCKTLAREKISPLRSLSFALVEMTPDTKSNVLAIITAAGTFALAHVLITHQPAAALTFLPSLLFGWLYHKTGSLTTPIAMHLIANIFYLMAAWIL